MGADGTVGLLTAFSTGDTDCAGVDGCVIERKARAVFLTTVDAFCSTVFGSTFIGAGMGAGVDTEIGIAGAGCTARVSTANISITGGCVVLADANSAVSGQ